MKKVLSALSLGIAAVLVFLAGDKTATSQNVSQTIASAGEHETDACVLPSQNSNEMLFLGCGGYLE